MYNEELKTRFIQEYSRSVNTSNVCGTMFNAIEKYELAWGADICTKDEATLRPVLEELVGFRARSKWARLTILRDYAKWCMSLSVPGACDSILKIQVSGLEKMKSHTISSPAHLERYLNDICEPVYEKTTDNIYRCYYWLAYAGIKEEDILKIRCEDVDFSNMIIRYKNTEVPLYREAVQAFRNCVELTQFVYKHPLYSADKILWRDRVPGDIVVRGVKAQPSLQAMRVALSRLSKNKRDKGATNLNLSYYRVWISGVFYRAYEEEQMGTEPDFTALVSSQMEGKVYKMDSGKNTQEAKKRQLVHDYLEDYQRWKLIFKK